MRHPANVGFVDAHAEGDGRHDNQPVIGLEAALDLAPGVGVHSAVIGQRALASVTQGGGKAFGLGAGAAVDDARLALARGSKGQDLLAGAVLRGKGKVDIGAVKPAEELARLTLAKELLNDLGAGFGVGGGRESGERHIKRAAQRADAQVVGTEIVPPLADAMRFIDGKQRDARLLQKPVSSAGGKAFRRHVEQFQVAAVKRVEDRVGFLRRIGRGQRGGRYAGGVQGAHLVAHQGDERRDHDGQAGAQKRGQLEAERLAPAGRQDGKHVFAGCDRFHDVTLHGAKPVKAEDTGKKINCGRGGPVHHIPVVSFVLLLLLPIPCHVNVP